MNFFFTGFNCTTFDLLRGPQRHERVWRPLPGRVDGRRAGQAVGHLCWTSGEKNFNWQLSWGHGIRDWGSGVEVKIARSTSEFLVQIPVLGVRHKCYTATMISKFSTFLQMSLLPVFCAISDFRLENSCTWIFSLISFEIASFFHSYWRNPSLVASTRKITSVVTFEWRTPSSNTSTLSPFSTLLCVTPTTTNVTSSW